MKKIIVLLFILNILTTACYATNTDVLIKKIENASVSARPVKMQRFWKELCELDETLCTEKQDWFDNLLYETKTRQHDLYIIRGGAQARSSIFRNTK